MKTRSSVRMNDVARRGERGNAMIYVIIVIALFAALTFITSRQSDSGETASLSREKINIVTSSILQSAARIYGTVEQATFTGTDPANLDFTLPSDSAFEDPPTINKVFHPDGGGVVLPQLPAGAVHETTDTPPPGWYLGRFNNVEWSQDDATQDIILTAYQLSEDVCARINSELTGDDTIPVLGKPAHEVLIARVPHHSTTNTDFEIADCTGRSCEGHPALCVKDSGDDIWAFYNLIMPQ